VLCASSLKLIQKIGKDNMCGIAGIIEKNSKENFSRMKNLEAMLEVQHHRGPDGRGIEEIILTSEICLFGHNRLSILDLSDNGRQPMQSYDGSVTLTFNGEIYNANDFREDLLSKGYRFRSTSDTEVLLYLYQEYGLEYVVNNIRGMFSFGIADKKNDVVYFARDCFGEKPFYYYVTDKSFLFSSEVKCFYKCEEFQPELNETVLDEYFMFRYVTGEDTLLKGVKQLLPGCYLTYKNGSIVIQRFYSQQKRRKKITKRQAKEILSSRLAASTKEQLYSDVPVGIMLSGGIDSSLVAKFASENNNSIQSFSVVFEDENYSEEKYMDYVAGNLNIVQNKYPMNGNDFIENVKKCTYHMDFPINHPNSLGVFLLTRSAKDKVTVLLGGEGADELMGGYGNFTYHETEKFLRGFPLYNIIFGNKFKRFYNRATTKDENIVLFTAYGNENSLRSLRPNCDIDAAVKKRLDMYNGKKGDSIQRTSQYYMDTYLLDLLNRVDKMSMANSMEMRSPFLSRELVDAVRTIDTRFFVGPTFSKKKMSRNVKKLLKEVSCDAFGKEFTFRPKMGWPLPLKHFFMDYKMHQYIEKQLIPQMRARAVVNTLQIEKWWGNLAILSAFEVETLWIAIAFEVWAGVFLDKRAILD